MITIEAVSKRFAGPKGEPVDALTPVDLTIPAGQFLSIVGPSGCGKSTLLRIIAGLETPSDGKLTIAATGVARPIGFVFQEPVLLPWLSTLANIRFPLDTGGVPRAEADATAHRLIKMVGLQGFEDALPHQLSGGMRQRAAIARALSYDPPILEWAVAGLGIAALPTFIAGDQIHSGALVPLLMDFPTPEFAVHVVRPPGANASAKLRLLIEALVERFGGEPYWDRCLMAQRD
jgi:ABC-type histidine transport system ATPase subunit